MRQKKLKTVIVFILIMISSLNHAIAHKNQLGLTTAHFINVPIKSALQLLADFNQTNIIIDDSIDGSITLSLKNLPWQTIWQTVLQSKQLEQKSINHIIYIAPLTKMIIAEKTHEQFIQQSPLKTILIRLNYANASKIAKLFKTQKNSPLSKMGYIAFDNRTNSLFIRDHQAQLAQIKPLVKALDIPVPQVMIAAKIVNIDKNYEKNLGIKFELDNDSENLVDPFAILKLSKGRWLNATLFALEKDGHAEILSNPKLFTANQETATIEAGEEIPYQEAAGEGATKTTFKKAVLSLKVTPQITRNHKIILKLSLNQDKPSAKTVQGVPAIDTQKITTQILIDNGQTVALGGIYERNQSDQMERIPFLGRLPFIGVLFQHRFKSNTRRELLIFVTPSIIK